MTGKSKGTPSTFAVLVCTAALGVAHTRAQAPLFDSIDENFNPVSMADMIDGRPLVLAVSSCS